MTNSGPLVLSVDIGIVFDHFTIQFLAFNKKSVVSTPKVSTPCCQNNLNPCTYASCVANDTKQKEETDGSCPATKDKFSKEPNDVDKESPPKYCRCIFQSCQM